MNSSVATAINHSEQRMMSALRRVVFISLLTLINAIFVVLMYPPANIWPLAYIAIAPLVMTAFIARRTWHLLLGVGIVQILLWLWMQRWTAGITTAGYAPLAMYCAIWPTLFTIVLHRLLRHKRVARLPMVLLVPILWTGIEFFRGAILFNGYPWFLLGHPLVEWPMQVQSADILGTYFIGSGAAAISGLLVDVARWKFDHYSARVVIASAVSIIVLFIANLGYGAWRLNQRDVYRAGPTILALQTNLPQDNRNAWTAEMQARDIPGFMAQTRQGLAQTNLPIDLIVWPETMVPGVGFEPEVINTLQGFGSQAAYLYRWPLEVEQFAHQLELPMLVGSPAWVEPQLERVDGMVELRPPKYRYNSAYLVVGELPYQRYDKFFLTPFGETMPYISNWPWLEQKLLSIGAQGMSFNLDAADEIKTLDFEFAGQTIGIGTPICFEDCLPHVIRQMVYAGGTKRAELLVNISNDGWFTWDDGSRAQRVQISRLRCIENRVPLVRSVNTGLSVHIDSTGIVAGVIGDGRYGTSRMAGVLIAQMQLDSRHTIYGRVGDVWGWWCLIGLGIGTIIALRRPNVR